MALLSPHDQSSVLKSPEVYNAWGWLPVLSIVIATGLWLTSVSYVAGRNGEIGAMTIFALGLFLMLASTLARLVQTNVGRVEILGSLLILGLGLYLVTVLRYPGFLASYDELLHYRTADDILQTLRLFTSNSLLPVSPLFPGLEIATTALANLSGWNIYLSGVIVIGSARLMMLLGLFLLFERLAQSARLAGLGTIIYMGSSTFMFFDTSFAYESVGLPLATCVVYTLLRSSQTESARERGIWNGLALLLIFVVVITHHATGYILTGFLFVWSGVAFFMRRKNSKPFNPFGFALVTLIFNLFWLFSIANITIGYLQPYMIDAVSSLQGLLTGHGGDRQILTVATGQGGIDYERILAYASVACIMAGIGLGLVYWWRKRIDHSLAFAFVLCSLVYPAIPLLRLNSKSWQFSNRLAGFLFIALGFVIALGLTRLELPKRLMNLRNALAIPMLIIIFYGGIVAGSSPLTRLPGPYVIVADDHSVDSQGLKAAQWAHTRLGVNNRMAGDRVQTILMGSYGAQRMITNGSDNVSVSGIFLKYNLDNEIRSIIDQTQLQYLVIDRRVSAGKPFFGYYFEEWEQQIVATIPPVNPALLDKFDHFSKVSRVFDSGDIVVYDIEALAHAQ